MDNITLIRSAGEDVCADLTKRSRKYTTVKIVHDGVYFGLRGRDAALGVAIGWVTLRKWESLALLFKIVNLPKRALIFYDWGMYVWSRLIMLGSS